MRVLCYKRLLKHSFGNPVICYIIHLVEDIFDAVANRFKGVLGLLTVFRLYRPKGNEKRDNPQNKHRNNNESQKSR
ncbi:hypothetical protein D3C81_1478310 [compost metagenome]